jgi:hypothetical protein
MMSGKARSTALLLLLALAACSTPREKGSRAPAVGESAPGFTLPATTGEEISLAGLSAEKAVIVVFYRGRF